MGKSWWQYPEPLAAFLLSLAPGACFLSCLAATANPSSLLLFTVRREVNVALFSPEEFRQKLASADHFLSSVMNAKTIPLKGSLNELEQTASKQ
jgi:hypothetical protein